MLRNREDIKVSLSGGGCGEQDEMALCKTSSIWEIQIKGKYSERSFDLA